MPLSKPQTLNPNDVAGRAGTNRSELPCEDAPGGIDFWAMNIRASVIRKGFLFGFLLAVLAVIIELLSGFYEVVVIAIGILGFVLRELYGTYEEYCNWAFRPIHHGFAPLYT